MPEVVDLLKPKESTPPASLGLRDYPKPKFPPKIYLEEFVYPCKKIFLRFQRKGKNYPEILNGLTF